MSALTLVGGPFDGREIDDEIPRGAFGASFYDALDWLVFPSVKTGAPILYVYTKAGKFAGGVA